jgi:hypothetical protein
MQDNWVRAGGKMKKQKAIPHQVDAVVSLPEFEYIIFHGYKTINGKRHFINRQVCLKCKKILSEMHYGCCGHMASGFNQISHKCGS